MIPPPPPSLPSEGIILAVLFNWHEKQLSEMWKQALAQFFSQNVVTFMIISFVLKIHLRIKHVVMRYSYVKLFA